MVDFISFPEEEYSSYLERLNNNLIIYTTRVSDEVNKYKLNHVYESYFGKLKVVSLQHFDNLENHLFYNELNEKQLDELSSNLDDRGYDIIGLCKVN